MAARSFCIQLTISKLPIAHLITHPPRFSWYTVADTHFTRRIFHAFPVKPWMVLVRTILFTFLSSPNDLTSPTFPLLSCRDARFFAVFPASCPVLCGVCSFPYRDAKFCYVFSSSCSVLCGVCSFRIVTQSICLFSLRRGIIWDCFAVKWNTTQSFVQTSLRRVRYVCLVVFFWGGLNGGMDYTILKTPVSYSSKPSERYRARAAVRDGFDVRYSDGLRSQPVVDFPIASALDPPDATLIVWLSCTSAVPPFSSAVRISISAV